MFVFIGIYDDNESEMVISKTWNEMLDKIKGVKSNLKYSALLHIGETITIISSDATKLDVHLYYENDVLVDVNWMKHYGTESEYIMEQPENMFASSNPGVERIFRIIDSYTQFEYKGGQNEY